MDIRPNWHLLPVTRSWWPLSFSFRHLVGTLEVDWALSSVCPSRPIPLIQAQGSPEGGTEREERDRASTPSTPLTGTPGPGPKVSVPAQVSSPYLSVSVPVSAPSPAQSAQERWGWGAGVLYQHLWLPCPLPTVL